MNKLRELILGNFYIKLLSFSIALVLWIVTMNINNPVIDKDISVPLTLKNEYLITDKGFVVVNKSELEDTLIQVRIKGKRNDINSFRNYKDAIVATVDLSQVDLSNEAILGQPISAPVVVDTNYPDVFTIAGKYPLTVIINVDIVESKTIPVYAEITGTPSSSYVIEGSPILSKNSTTITGPRSILRDVTKAVLPINVSNAYGDIETEITPVIYNANGADISTSIYSGLEPIKVRQKVAKATTVEIVQPSLIGKLPEGRSLGEYTIDITSVDVLADESNVNISFNPIVLDTIDISDIIETTTYQEDITQKLLDQGLKTKDGKPCVVTTTINVVVDVQKTILVPVTRIEFSTVTYSYAVSQSEFSITVAGPESVMETVDEKNFGFYCELPITGVAGEEFTASIDVTTPENVKLISVSNLKVQVEEIKFN